MIGKRGRPAKNEAKKYMFSFRLSKEESNQIDILAEKLNISRADVLRKGLKMVYNLTKYSD